jgi:hypothetical protein
LPSSAFSQTSVPLSVVTSFSKTFSRFSGPISPDKDQLRAEFAVSTRRLEMKIEKLKAQTASQLAELGKKTDATKQ